jgi:hypothetical protein
VTGGSRRLSKSLHQESRECQRRRLNGTRGVDEREERSGQCKRRPVMGLSRQICITCSVSYALVLKTDNLLNL